MIEKARIASAVYYNFAYSLFRLSSFVLLFPLDIPVINRATTPAKIPQPITLYVICNNSGIKESIMLNINAPTIEYFLTFKNIEVNNENNAHIIKKIDKIIKSHIEDVVINEIINGSKEVYIKRLKEKQIS